MQVRLGVAGYCTAWGPLLYRGSPARRWEFPALFALLRHPRQGWVLFDTGYAPRFQTATAAFPERLYRWTTPVHLRPGQSAADQLRSWGVEPAEVATVVLSHLHGDHVAGLADFPSARVVMTAEAWSVSQAYGRWRAVRAAFLRSLWPAGAEDRTEFLAPGDPRWREGEYWTGHWDLFGDGLLHVVPLPGHAPGHAGLVVQTDDRRLFLGADCAWTRAELDQRLTLAPLARTVAHDPAAYQTTQRAVRGYLSAHPDVDFVLTHCAETLAARSLSWR